MDGNRLVDSLRGNLGREDPSTSGNFAGSDNVTNIRINFFGLQDLFNAMTVNIGAIMPRDSFV